MLQCAESSRLLGPLGKTYGYLWSRNRKCNLEVNFKCSDGTCVPRYAVCDGLEICLDGSDEKNCNCKAIDCFYSNDDNHQESSFQFLVRMVGSAVQEQNDVSRNPFGAMDSTIVPRPKKMNLIVQVNQILH